MDGSGNLRIEAPLYTINPVTGAVEQTSTLNGKIIHLGYENRNDHSLVWMDVGSVSGANLSVTIPAPTGAMLANVEDGYDGFDPGLVISGAGTKTFFANNFQPKLGGAYLELFSDMQIENDGSGYEIVAGEEIWYIYSEGDITIFGTEPGDPDCHYDIKLTQGWNAITCKFYDDGEYNESKNPSSGARWIVEAWSW